MAFRVCIRPHLGKSRHPSTEKIWSHLEVESPPFLMCSNRLKLYMIQAEMNKVLVFLWQKPKK